MKTVSPALQRRSTAQLNVLLVALTTSLAIVAFVLICWIGVRLGLGPGTHMFISVFSDADVGSTAALIAAISWSFFGGGLIGAIFALIYNALAGLNRGSASSE